MALPPPLGRSGALAVAWRPGGVLYLLCMLAGLGVGLWPTTIVAEFQRPAGAPLPTLQTVAVAQVVFILLVQPLLAAFRAPRGRRGGWVNDAAESLVLLALAAPFYVVAAYLADAAATDVVRLVLLLVCLWPVGWVAGAFLAAGRFPSLVVLKMLLIAAGLPAAWYIASDFGPGAGASEPLWNASPALFAWSTAASRQLSPLPRPWWAAAMWPSFAACAAMVLMLLPKPPRPPAMPGPGTPSA